MALPRKIHLPAIGSLPSNIDPTLLRFCQAVKELNAIGEGINTEHLLEKKVTRRDLEALGIDSSVIDNDNITYVFPGGGDATGLPPGEPTNFIITQRAFSNRLAWTNPSNVDLSSINVWYSPDNSTWTLVAIVTSPTSVFNHSLLEYYNENQYYRIQAVNTEGLVSGFVTANVSIIVKDTINELTDLLFGTSDYYTHQYNIIADSLLFSQPSEHVKDWAVTSNYLEGDLVLYGSTAVGTDIDPSNAYTASVDVASGGTSPDLNPDWVNLTIGELAGLATTRPLLKLGYVDNQPTMGLRGDFIVDGGILARTISATDIFTNHLRSVNYVAGVSGYFLDAINNSAEFNNIQMVLNWGTDVVGTDLPEANATLGATWGSDIASQPPDIDLLNNISENSLLSIPNPVGGSFSSNVSLNPGAIVITLPQSWTDTMLKFMVDVYLYTADGAFSLEVGGYNYPDNTTWANTSAKLTGSVANDNRVRFGHDGAKCCIVIGDVTSQWSYPKINIRDFIAGFSNYAESQWKNGWSVSILDDLTGYVFTSDIADSLIDAKSILGQGALATQDRGDLLYEDGADVTSANTSLDTSNVNGTPAATVQANALNAITAANNQSADGILSTQEKATWRVQWLGMLANHDNIIAQATTYGIEANAEFVDFTSDKDTLSGYLTTTLAVWSLPDTPATISPDTQLTDYVTLFYDAMQACVNSLADYSPQNSVDAGLDTTTGGLIVRNSTTQDYAHLTAGDLNFFYWNGTSFELYQSVNRFETGRAVDGDVVTIDGIWNNPPLVTIIPATTSLYIAAYADQDQQLEVYASTPEETSVGSKIYQFTVTAKLNLAAAYQTQTIGYSPAELVQTVLDTWEATTASSTTTTIANCTNLNVSGTLTLRNESSSVGVTITNILQISIDGGTWQAVTGKYDQYVDPSGDLSFTVSSIVSMVAGTHTYAFRFYAARTSGLTGASYTYAGGTVTTVVEEAPGTTLSTQGGVVWQATGQ